MDRAFDLLEEGTLLTETQTHTRKRMDEESVDGGGFDLPEERKRGAEVSCTSGEE